MCILLCRQASLNKRRNLGVKKAAITCLKPITWQRCFAPKFMHALTQAGHRLPYQSPKKWNADCECVGSGNSALTYLARYLYRGVISEDNIRFTPKAGSPSGTKTVPLSNTSALPSLPSIFYGGCCSMCYPKAFVAPGTMVFYTATPGAPCCVFNCCLKSGYRRHPAGN